MKPIILNQLITFETLLNKGKYDYLELEFNKLLNNKSLDSTIHNIETLRPNDFFNKKDKFIDFNYSGFHKVTSYDFVDDFLIPNIRNMFETHLNLFTQSIKNKNLWGDSQIKNYSIAFLKQLDYNKDKTNEASHLIDKVKEELIIIIERLYEYVSNEYYQEHYNIPDKIPVKWGKKQLVIFFHLLYKNDIIPNDKIKTNDFFRLLEQYFEFFNKQDDAYKRIKKARKLDLELFGLNSVKSTEKLLTTLEIIFSDSDFYNNI